LLSRTILLYKYHEVVNSFIETDTKLTQLPPPFPLTIGEREGGIWFYVLSISMKLSTSSMCQCSINNKMIANNRNINIKRQMIQKHQKIVDILPSLLADHKCLSLRAPAKQPRNSLSWERVGVRERGKTVLIAIAW
jgi:hypothetical protein